MKDKRVLTEPDFILAPKFSNSLTVFMDRYPDGIKDIKDHTISASAQIAKLLGISEEEVVRVRDTALLKLREQI